MTLDEKRKAYRDGRYNCEVPPVSTAYWNEDDWIRFIEKTGGFYDRQADDRQAKDSGVEKEFA